jgi:hypothetical protein
MPPIEIFENPLFRRRLRIRAWHAVRATVAEGAGRYRRAHLNRLLPIGPDELAQEGPEATRAIIARLEQALRSERARCGHWTYDLNRHIGLAQACKAERARLAEETRVSRSEKTKAASNGRLGAQE